jgi:hypothetical protein
MKKFIMSPYLSALLIVLIAATWIKIAKAEGAEPEPFCDEISRQEGVC